MNFLFFSCWGSWRNNHADYEYLYDSQPSEKNFQPYLLDSHGKVKLSENHPSANSLPKDLLKIILRFYLELNDYKPLHFMLANKHFYEVAMSHPFIRLANIIAQLNSIPSWKDTDKVNFKGLMLIKNHSMTVIEINRLKRIDPDHRVCKKCVKQSEEFFNNPYYKPLVEVMLRIEKVRDVPIPARVLGGALGEGEYHYMIHRSTGAKYGYLYK